MNCPRCTGCFLREYAYDDEGHKCEMLRCIQCGEMVDEVILRHRYYQAKQALPAIATTGGI